MAYNNSYHKFTGTQGFQIKDDLTYDMTNYTLTLWYRLQATAKDLGRPMTLVNVKPDGFSCVYNTNLQIQCNGDRGGQINLNGNVRLHNWYILIIRSVKSPKLNKSELKIMELSSTIFLGTESSQPFPSNMQSQTGTLSLNTFTLGIHDDLRSQGFVGNLRNFRLFEDFFDDQTTYKLQYIYLIPLSYIKMQVLQYFNNLQNLASSMKTGQFVGSTIQIEYDYMGILQCTTSSQFNNSFMYKQPLQLDSSIRFNKVSMGLTTIQQKVAFSLSREVSFQTWIYRPGDIKPTTNEILVDHQTVLKIYYQPSNTSNLIIENYYGVTLRARTPLNKWLFIQVIRGKTSIQFTMWDIEQTQLSTQSASFSAVTSESKYDVNFYESFNGYSFGLKYFRGVTPQRMNVHYFSAIPDPGGDTSLFSYLFNVTGLQSGTTNQFKGYGTGGKNLVVVDSNSMKLKFTSIQYIENGLINQVAGTKAEQVRFDGYSCIDEKVKLFFPKGDSYASFPLKVSDQQIENFTIEFWFRATQGLTGENYMYSIADNPRSSMKQYFSIYQESDGILACYPQLAQLSSKLRYHDYSPETKRWIHIACVYDQSASQIRGLLLQNNIELPYYSEMQQKGNLMQQNYMMYLSLNSKTMMRGSPNSFYLDFRFWSVARSFRDIQSYRYQQLDLNNLGVPSQSLLTYIKLLSGIQANAQGVEMDYVSKQNLSIAQGTTWSSDNENYICPVGTFRPSNYDTYCYRETINSVQFLVYKTTKGYIVTSYFSSFRNLRLRDSAITYYNHQWTVDQISTPSVANTQRFRSSVERQQNTQTLEILYDDIIDNSKYTLSLTIQDKMQMQDMKSGQFSFFAYNCAWLYDRHTRQSWVYKDLEIIKGEADYTFYYDYSDCADYKFDPSLMQFSIDGYSDLSGSDNNGREKSFTLRSVISSSLPVNDFFYLKVRGTWKHVRNQYDQISQHMVYVCRFPSKFVASLSPSSVFLIKGQQLTINSEVKFINQVHAAKDRTYRGRWQCPGKLNDFCSIVTGPTLRLVYDTVAQSGYQFWTPQNFSYIITPLQMQSDGTKTSSSTVLIQWIDVKQDLTVKTLNSQNRNVPFSWQVDDEIPRMDLFWVSWEISPSVAFSCFPNYANRSQFSVSPSCLKEGAQYEVTAKLMQIDSKNVISTQKVTFVVPRKPSGGNLNCNPVKGIAYVDKIKCVAAGWSATDNIIKYQFFSQDANGTLTVASAVQSSNELNNVFPPTQQIVVKVIDKFDQSTLASVSVNITYSSENSTTNIINKYNETTTPPSPPPTPTPTPPTPPPPKPPAPQPPTPVPPSPVTPPPQPPTPVPPTPVPPTTIPPTPVPPTPVPPTTIPPTPVPPTPTPVPPQTPTPVPPTPVPPPTPIPPNPPTPPTPPNVPPSLPVKPLSPPDISTNTTVPSNVKVPTQMVSDFITAASSLSYSQNQLSSQELSNQVSVITRNLRAVSIGEIQSSDDRKYFVQGTVQVYKDLSSLPPRALNATNLLSMQQQINGVLAQGQDTLDLLKNDQDFQRNIFVMQSNMLKAIQNQVTANNDLQGKATETMKKDLNDASSQLRQNLVLYETYLSPKTVEGEPYVQNSSEILFSIRKLNKNAGTSNLTDISFSSPDLNFSFPLSSASQPTMRQSFTMINYKTCPFAGSTAVVNQSLLTNSTVYFAYRNSNGTYLDYSYILDYIKMNFSIPGLRQKLQTAQGALSCAYQSSSDKFWRNQSCITEHNLEQEIIMCKCKHMSYYTVIDNSFDEEEYIKSLMSGDLYTIKVENWVFFIPLGYLLLLFIWGIIYNINKDHNDSHFIDQQSDRKLTAEPQNRFYSLQLTSLIFYRKVQFQSLGNGTSFCSILKIFILTLHPLFQFKYRMDPTLPRVYKFLSLYARIVISFGLSFYFLRDRENLDVIFAKEGSNLNSELLLLGLSLLIGAFLLIPLPIWLYGLCRSSYYLAQQDRFTDAGSREDPGATTPSPISASAPANNDQKQDLKGNPLEGGTAAAESLMTKIRVDASLPFKLLFLINASTHEKLLKQGGQGAFNFASGRLDQVARKLVELESLSTQQDNNTAQEDHKQIVPRLDLGALQIAQGNGSSMQKTYIVDQFTEVDLINGGDKSIRNNNLNAAEKKGKAVHQKGNKSTLIEQRRDSVSRLINVQQERGQQLTRKSNKTAGGQRIAAGGGRLISHQEIKLNFDNQGAAAAAVGGYRSSKDFSHAHFSPTDPHHERNQSSYKEKSHRSSNRISQTEGDEEKDKLDHNHFEGGESYLMDNTAAAAVNGPSGVVHAGGSVSSGLNEEISNNNLHFDDLIREDSGITIDSNIVASDDRKELLERKGLAICGRILGLLLAFVIIVGILGYVIYLYYTESIYNQPLKYTWVAVFFASQFLGFFIIDMLILMLMTSFVHSCCCKRHKLCLSRLMRDSLYIYEDYRYVLEYSRQNI